MATKQHGACSLLTINDEAIVALNVLKGEKHLFPGNEARKSNLKRVTFYF